MVTGTLLTILAHPDDAELWAGATIARHVDRGGTAVIAVPHHDAVRDREAAAGAHILGASVYQLPAITPETAATLLTEVRPDVLIVHPCEDGHPHHRACSEAVHAALPDVVIATGKPRRAYECDSYNNLDRSGRPLKLPVILDVTAQWARKIQAIAEHRSQPVADHFGPMAEGLGRLHGARIEREYGEAFRPIPLLGRLQEAADL